MKKILTIIVILIVLGIGVTFFLGDIETSTSVVPAEDESSMPIPGVSGEVSEENEISETGEVSEASENETGVCIMDAKLCPDGSYVSRSGPNCEFAVCPSDGTQEVKEFTVSAANFSFTPSVITVKQGDRVKITFENTQGFHDFVIDEYGISVPQAQSPATSVIEFTADKTGSFEYYCSVGTHRALGMEGALVVE